MRALLPTCCLFVGLVSSLAATSTSFPGPREAGRTLTLSGTCPQLPQGHGGAEPDVIPLDVQFAVSVTPDGGQVTWNANTNGHTSTFTVTNTGTCQDTYNFSKSATGPISGVTINKTSATLAAGASTTVTVNFTAGALGTGVLTLHAAGNSGDSDNGTYNVTNASYVAVTPDAQVDAVVPGASVAVRFQVKNTGPSSTTYSLTCST